MIDRSTPSTVSMKGGGYYSEHTQGAKDVIDNTASLALGALADVDVAAEAGPFTVADLGAADGVDRIYHSYVDLVRASPEGHAMGYVHVYMVVSKA